MKNGTRQPRGKGVKEKKARWKRAWYIEEIETDMGEVDQSEGEDSESL